MLPPELDIQPGGGRSKKGLFNLAGDLHSYITGVATQTDLQSLQEPMVQLENFLNDKQDSNRIQLGQLLIAERLVSKRIDDIVANVKKHAASVAETFESLTVQTFGLNKEIQWLNFFTQEAVKWTYYSTRVTRVLDYLIEGLSWANLQVLSPHLLQTSSLIEILACERSYLQKNATIAMNVIPSSGIKWSIFTLSISAAR